MRVYREDLDDETWELVASNRFLFCFFKPPTNKDAKNLPDHPETYHYPYRDELAALVELLTDKETFARTVSQEEMEEEDSMQVGCNIDDDQDDDDQDDGDKDDDDHVGGD